MFSWIQLVYLWHFLKKKQKTKILSCHQWSNNIFIAQHSCQPLIFHLYFERECCLQCKTMSNVQLYNHTKHALWLWIKSFLPGVEILQFSFLTLLVPSSRVRHSGRAAGGKINLQVSVKKTNINPTLTQACSPTLRPSKCTLDEYGWVGMMQVQWLWSCNSCVISVIS